MTAIPCAVKIHVGKRRPSEQTMSSHMDLDDEEDRDEDVEELDDEDDDFGYFKGEQTLRSALYAFPASLSASLFTLRASRVSS